MNVQVQIAVPFAVGIPDGVAMELLDVVAAMGFGATDSAAGAGNVTVFVTQPVDVALPDNVVAELQDAINKSGASPRVIGPASPEQQPAPAAAPAPAPAPTASSPIDFADAIAAAGATYGVPPILLDRIWRIEAGGAFPNPCLNDGTHIGGCYTAAQAPHGYGGLFGLNQDTARANGFSLDDPTTTQQQANLAASILRMWHDRLGSWVAAANAFNVGPNGSGGYGPTVAAGLD